MIIGSLFALSYAINLGVVLQNKYTYNNSIKNKLKENCTINNESGIVSKIHSYLKNHNNSYKELYNDRKKSLALLLVPGVNVYGTYKLINNNLFLNESLDFIYENCNTNKVINNLEKFGYVKAKNKENELPKEVLIKYELDKIIRDESDDDNTKKFKYESDIVESYEEDIDNKKEKVLKLINK